MPVLCEWLDHGLELSEGRYNLGFPFLYSLMTGTLTLKVLPEDNSLNWGAVLLRLLPWQDLMQKDLLMSILKALASNPDMAAEAPKLAPKAKKDKLIRHAHQYFNSKRNVLSWPRSQLTYKPPASIALPSLGVLQQRSRAWFTLRTPDLGCSGVPVKAFTIQGLSMTAADVAAFSEMPLAHINIESYISFGTNAQRGQGPVSDAMPFDVSLHPMAQSHVARQMWVRLKASNEDVAWFANEQRTATSAELRGFSMSEVQSYAQGGAAKLGAVKSRLESLEEQLRSLQHEDGTWVERGLTALLQQAATAAAGVTEERLEVGFALRSLAGQELRLSLEKLIELLLCTAGEQVLKYVNPYTARRGSSSGSTVASEILDLLIGVMLRATRRAQVGRCLAQLRGLLGVIQQVTTGDLTGDVAYQALSRGSESLAEELGKKRYYIFKGRDGQPALDPRLLLMEFSSGILLHKAQVQLIGKFMSKTFKGESMCHQMIMGAGKTTVVAPTLALLLADGKRLVMEVVPDALLDFVVNIMRGVFSVGLKKPVYVFYFDRFLALTPSLLQKVHQATAQRAVMLTTPTSVKALMLKYVELLHKLEEARLRQDEVEGDALGNSRASRGFRRALGLRKRWMGKSEHFESVDDLKQQVSIGTKLLECFRSASLLLDEVDLILHPLKSELNWPLGKKRPLEFTRGRAGSALGDGLRWKIPLHLLDALFYYSEGRLVVDVAFRDSRRAKAVLDAIKVAVDEGCAARLMQQQPHLVILSRKYYHERLQPLLAQWVLMWLRQKRLRGVGEDMVIEYLMKGAESSSAAVTGQLKDALSDEHMRMLNLTHDWLVSFLPHCLSKINRVTFGLLSPADLKRALEADPFMPKSRKLLAVPFVGKDAPSRASEFSHPDITLGMTILAYR
ncbi:unnamed protein product [Chrysoparadoxa australica]